jgi:cytolysin (calcineurin-like family phosphatase)
MFPRGWYKRLCFGSEMRKRALVLKFHLIALGRLPAQIWHRNVAPFFVALANRSFSFPEKSQSLGFWTGRVISADFGAISVQLQSGKEPNIHPQATPKKRF